MNDSEIQTGIKLEVCIDSLESALAAVRGGADRLEICSNLALGGGTTPSVGLVRLVKRSCPSHIELMAMIRPRTGDFLYSRLELSIMLEDIVSFAEVGITGVVLGALRADGTVDVGQTRTLADEAVRCKMQVCFHRAFDMVVDQHEALSALRSIPGISRILTSGGSPTAPGGLPSLISLCSSLQAQTQIPSTAESIPENSPPSATKAETQMQIMPGSGVNAHTAPPLLRTLLPLGPHVRALHLSGAAFVSSSFSAETPPGSGSGSEFEFESASDSEDGDMGGGRGRGMLYRKEGMGMGVGGAGEWGVWRTSEKAVRAVREVADREWEVYMKTQTQERV